MNAPLRLLCVALSIGSPAILVACGGGGGGGAAAKAADRLVQITTPATVPSGATGQPFGFTIQANFPHPPGAYYVTGGALPVGTQLDHATGSISGYPREVGHFAFEIAARDGVDPSFPSGRDASYAEDRRTFQLDVARGAVQILPQLPPSAQYRSSYSYQIDAAGGTPPYTFAKVGGSLPNGLTVSSNGIIGNFPTQGVPSHYLFDVTVTDSVGEQHTKTLSLDVVILPLLILTSTLPGAAKDFFYDTTIVLASNGGGAPYTWSQKAPAVGEVTLASIGVEISPDGHLRNQLALPGPSVLSPPGGWLFTLQVIDEATQVAERQFSLTVNPGPVVTSVTPNTSVSGGPFTVLGANFQPGAKVIFKPGPSQTQVSPTFVNSTQLQFTGPVPLPTGGGSVTVRVLNPDGGFGDRANGFVFQFANLSFGTKGFVVSGLSSTGLACADLNGDGKAEIVHCGASGITAYPGGATSTTGGLHLFVNNGGLSFSQTTLDGGNYYDVKIADVNTDGKPDIVALGATSVRVWINNPLGTLTAGPISALPSGFAYPSEMAMGLLNGDAVPDVAFGVALYSNPNGRVYTMFGDGSGGFTLLASAVSSMATTNGVVSLTCLDLNSDGRSDIVAGTGWINGSGNMFQWSNTTAAGQIGTWTSTSAAPFLYGNTLGVCAADFLGTGAPAMFMVHTEDPGDGSQRLVRLYSGSTLTSVTTLAAPTGLGKSVSAADLDYDGKADAGVTSAPGVLSIYRGSTLSIVSTLDASAGLPSITSPRTGRVAFGDLDGDGRIDALATTSYWITDYQPNVWGATFALNLAGDGGTKGVVYWLNSSN